MTLDIQLRQIRPRAFFLNRFENIRWDLVRRRTNPFDIHLQIVARDTLRIQAQAIGEDPLEAFKIRVPERLLDFIALYFFEFCRRTPSLLGTPLGDPESSGLIAPADEEFSLEESLANLPLDLPISGKRSELFHFILAKAFDYLLLHETTHIAAGHLTFARDYQRKFGCAPPPHYIRAFEMDADNTAARLLADGRSFAPWPISIRNFEEHFGKATDTFALHALIAASLFLVMGDFTTFPHPLEAPDQSHPPSAFRAVFAVAGICAQAPWKSYEHRLRAHDLILNDAASMLRLVAGKPPYLGPPEFYAKQQIAWFDHLKGLDEAIRPEWVPFALKLLSLPSDGELPPIRGPFPD